MPSVGPRNRQGPQGEQGPQGLSAYEIALENGFRGTEDEWLESLKGDRGARGPKGERGEKGEPGETKIIYAGSISGGGSGEPGPPGPEGPEGPPGSFEFQSEIQRTILSSIAAYDKEIDILYADQGLRFERVISATYSSDDFPDSEMTKQVYWLDAQTMNQRIEKIEYTGGILTSGVRRIFNYNQEGIRFRLDSISTEIF